MLRRTQAGIERDDFRQRTGFDLDALAGETIERFTAQGSSKTTDGGSG